LIEEKEGGLILIGGGEGCFAAHFSGSGREEKRWGFTGPRKGISYTGGKNTIEH